MYSANNYVFYLKKKIEKLIGRQIEVFIVEKIDGQIDRLNYPYLDFRLFPKTLYYT